jgi:hypothetical protein
MSDELERIRKETVVVYFNILSWHSPGEAGENHENLKSG